VCGSGSDKFADGSGVEASFYEPCGLCFDETGSLYVADRSNHRIRKVTPSTGHVMTVSGGDKPGK
jgi:sugar lactone lactonase YvrE